MARSSYIDHRPHPGTEGVDPREVIFSWDHFTRRRLDWLYGPGRASTPEAKADLEAWNALGRKAAA